MPFASTVYELEEPEVIAESELERESAQEAESELIPEQPEAFQPASEESPDSDDDPKDPKDLNDLNDSNDLTDSKDLKDSNDLTDPDISEDSEVPAIPKKRFWPGFLIGFAAACLIAFVAVWALFEYGVLSSERLAEAEPKPAVKAAAMTPGSVEVPAVEPDKSKSEPEPAAKEPEVQQPEVQKSAPETETEPPVPTQPSDKKVYDTITKTRYLTTMAKDHYGNYHLWPYIYQENEKILGHPDRIRPGTKVVVPPLSKYGVNPDNKADIDKAKKLGNEIYARYN